MSETYILIAEDDPDDRFLLQTAFEEVNSTCELKFVENGVELLDFLHAEAASDTPNRFPAFVLLDLNMPRKDGREVLAELKSSQVFQAIPVIIFSTTNNEHEMKRCYELGANSYITKPSSFERLQHTVLALCDYWIQPERVSQQLEA
jgi:two-component system response regulator